MTADKPVQTTTVSLAAVLARVEAAQEPDRDLDAAIVAAITPGIVGIEREPLAPDALNYLFTYDPPRRWSDSWLPVPEYTASIDAALSLAPAGAGIKLDRYWMMSLAAATEDRGPEHGRVWSALLTWGISGQSAASEDRPSAALALCAAALRAKMEASDAE